MDTTGEAAQWQNGQPRLRILIVEDHPDCGESFAILLRLNGYEVDVACDGPAGLEAAKAKSPDVALLDLGLPGMDGCEVAKRLKEQLTAKPPFLIAITGHGRDIDRQQSEEAGIGLHLVKPVDPHELLQILLMLGEYRVGNDLTLPAQRPK